MASPVEFPEANAVRTAPSGIENCGDLHVYSDGKVCISKWKLSGTELMRVLETGCVWIHVYSGVTQPPIAVSAFSAFDK